MYIEEQHCWSMELVASAGLGSVWKPGTHVGQGPRTASPAQATLARDTSSAVSAEAA